MCCINIVNKKKHTFMLVLGIVLIIIFILFMIKLFIISSETQKMSELDNLDNSSTINLSRVEPQSNLSVRPLIPPVDFKTINFTIQNASSTAYNDFTSQRKNSPNKWTILYATKQSNKQNGTIYDLTTAEYVSGISRRLDYTNINAQNDSIDIRSYILDGSLAFCKKNPVWYCNVQLLDKSYNYSRDNMWEDPSKVSMAFSGTKEILGVNTTCYSLSDSVAGIRSTHCLYNGMILYSKILPATGGFTERMATSYKLSVDDGVFVLPAK